jgi:hypothetical protein
MVARLMSTKLDKLTELAKSLTRKKLEDLRSSGYLVPEKISERLGLEIGFEGDYRVFELVAAGERPEDAQVLTSLRGNIKTMEFDEIVISYDLLEQTKN